MVSENLLSNIFSDTITSEQHGILYALEREKERSKFGSGYSK